MESKFNELVRLNAARWSLIPQTNGRAVNTSTLGRWIRKGLAGQNGDRIKLEVVYVGRTPYVSARMVEDFFRAVTAARMANTDKTRGHADVTDNELRAANLLETPSPDIKQGATVSESDAGNTPATRSVK